MNITNHHPRIFHLDPAEYPAGFNHLDSIPLYDPAEICDYEPTRAQRWHNVLCWLEGLVRADKAQLAADRAAVQPPVGDLAKSSTE